jgi:oligopeptide/dipeptide ABC transporter ATP-binding protein
MRLATGAIAPRRAEIEAALQRVGIPEPSRVMRSYPHQLSAGLAQRVMIAMAIMASPALLIADEPTSAVDAPLRRTLLELLSSLQKERGMAMVLVTHDLSVARHYGDAILLMFGGRVVESASCKELFSLPIHPYAQILTQAMSVRGADQESLAAMARMITLPTKGCRYVGPCMKKQPRCFDEEPKLEMTGSGRRVRCHFWK